MGGWGKRVGPDELYRLLDVLFPPLDWELLESRDHVCLSLYPHCLAPCKAYSRHLIEMLGLFDEVSSGSSSMICCSLLLIFFKAAWGQGLFHFCLSVPSTLVPCTFEERERGWTHIGNSQVSKFPLSMQANTFSETHRLREYPRALRG